jgi:hypothetical protein
MGHGPGFARLMGISDDILAMGSIKLAANTHHLDIGRTRMRLCDLRLALTRKGRFLRQFPRDVLHTSRIDGNECGAWRAPTEQVRQISRFGTYAKSVHAREGDPRQRRLLT